MMLSHVETTYVLFRGKLTFHVAKENELSALIEHCKTTDVLHAPNKNKIHQHNYHKHQSI